MRTFRKLLGWGLSLLYVAFICYLTLFMRHIGTERITKGLFWEYKNFMWHDIGMNILLFIPLGILLGFALSRNTWKVIAFGFALSLAIELTQYILILGYCEADDVLNNTIGTMFGYFVRVGICKIKRFSHMEAGE